MIALTHRPSTNMAACQRTYVPQAAINLELAERQHAAYCRALAEHGAQVRTLDVNTSLPDCAFIEDSAIVLDEVAILCPMGTDSRRAEPGRIEPVLREYREVVRIDLPATLEGGDVLRIGRRLLVGESSRTNAAGIAALAAIAGRYGYDIRAVPVHACLHLKTACTALPDGRLLVNAAWIDVASLPVQELVHVPAAEPWAANLALVGNTVLTNAVHIQTAELIHRLSFTVLPVDLSEFAKAEGGVTCLSLLFP
jgi:dimethylargininase